MSDVYYEVVGEEPLEFCRSFRERRSAVRRAAFDWAERQGARGVMEAWGHVWGLIFPNAKAPPGWKAERKRAADGSTIHTPHRKTDAGKAIKAEMDALEREPSPDEFAKEFGIPTSLSYKRKDLDGGQRLTSIFPYTSFIAWVNSGDSFWVVLPDIDATIDRHVADDCVCDPSSWTVPAGIVRSTRARYDLAVAAQAVADESPVA